MKRDRVIFLYMAMLNGHRKYFMRDGRVMVKMGAWLRISYMDGILNQYVVANE